MSAMTGTAKADFSTERVEGLLSRIREYERYFGEESTGESGSGENETSKDKKLDHQGTTAYINLVKLVCSLKEAEALNIGDPEERAREARRIFQEEYGVQL